MIRWWSIPVAGALIGLAGGLIAYNGLPKTYEATTKIFVTPSQIPQQFVRTTVTEDMGVRLQSLSEAVLSRPFLTKIIEQFFHMPSNPAEQERVLNQVRAQVDSQLLEYDERRGAGLFALTFYDSDPQRAADVANTIADLYIEENVRLRTGQAESTASTLGSLADEIAEKMRTQEKAIADFRARHVFELADHLDANMQLLSTRQAALESNARSLAAAEDRLQLLQTRAAELSDNPQKTVTTPGAPPASPAARLATARQELNALTARYTEEHPLVRAKQREVAALEDEVAATRDGDGASARPRSPEAEELALQIQAARNEIARLNAERDGITAEIRQFTARIEATPRVEQQLAELSKGYSVLSDRYKDYQAKFEEAKGSIKIEEARKGSQFEVVERASAASFPISPVRARILAIGVAIGLLLLTAPLVVPALLAPKVSFGSGIELLGETPLIAVVEEIVTPAVRQRRFRRQLLNAAWSASALVVLVVVVAVLRGGTP